jgi:hypothetical protein
MPVTLPRKRSAKSLKGEMVPGLLTAPPLQGPMGEAHEVEVITNGSSHEFIAAWQKLYEQTSDENPFLSPMFIVPALAHLCKEFPLTLVATWQNNGKDRHLTGLFPLASAKRQSVRGWLFGATAVLWNHSLLPFSEPLLARDPDLAEASAAAFVDWLLARRPRLSSFVLPSLRDNGHVRSVMEAEFLRHGVVLHSQRDQARTRGLDFKPSLAPDVTNKVVIARDVPDIKRDLEKALCMDAMNSSPSGSSETVLGSLEKSAFLRAVVRGFAAQGKLCIAHIDEPDAKASAIVIEGDETAFLWWIMGPQAGNPMIEASLSAAIETALGKKIIAATSAPMAGVWAEPLKTLTITAQLSSAQQRAA